MTDNNRDEQIDANQNFSSKLKKYLKNLFDFSNYDAKTIVYIILFIVLIIISLVLLYFIFFIDNTILYRFVVEFFVNPVYRLGVIGIFLFIAIMGIQGLLVPLPSEIVLLATSSSTIFLSFQLNFLPFILGKNSLRIKVIPDSIS